MILVMMSSNGFDNHLMQLLFKMSYFDDRHKSMQGLEGRFVISCLLFVSNSYNLLRVNVIILKS